MFNQPFDGHYEGLRVLNDKLRYHKRGKLNVPNDRNTEQLSSVFRVKQIEYTPSLKEFFMAGAILAFFVYLKNSGANI